MKALIPVAGIGTRLRPHTHTQPKALIPVAGKPMLGHIIDFLMEGGIREFIFVIGYLGSKIEDFVESDYSEKGISTDFVLQEPRMGSAHAVYAAKELINPEEELLVMLGDTILEMDLDSFLASPESIIGIKKVDKPGGFGVAKLDDTGMVIDLVEKPRIPKSNMALVGIYKVTDTQSFMEAICLIIENNRKTLDEFQLTDAFMQMVLQGVPVRSQVVDHWYDCGQKEPLLAANAILLNKPDYQGLQTQIFPKTIIVPPVSIGKNCRIENSIIGPNVAIGEETTISYTIAQNSIIGSYSNLVNSVLESSVIGNDSSLIGWSQSLNIGDNTEINFTR